MPTQRPTRNPNPETRNPKPENETGHDSKADIWSVGCTVIQMLTAAAPWNNISNAQALMFHVGSAKNTPPVPEGVSDECRAFLTACFQLQPEDRPTCKELLCLEFVACSCAGSL
jgi:serine/threonine protein kinase